MIKLKDQIKQATDNDGAKIIYGDVNFKLPDPELAQGNFVMPIVTEGIKRGSLSFSEEFFGPVFNLYKVDSAEHAL